MTASQWCAVGAVAVGFGAFLCALWASQAEQDAPGWRNHLSVGGAFASAALVGVALQLAE